MEQKIDPEDQKRQDALVQVLAAKRRFKRLMAFLIPVFMALFILFILFTHLPFYAWIMGGLAVGVTASSVMIAFSGWLAVIIAGGGVGVVISWLVSRGLSTNSRPAKGVL